MVAAQRSLRNDARQNNARFVYRPYTPVVVSRVIGRIRGRVLDVSFIVSSTDRPRGRQSSESSKID